MLEHARTFLLQAGVAAGEVVRVDVPGRGGGEEGAGAVRAEIEPAIPLLQSGSLFGGMQGLELVDAHQLTVAEAEVLAALLADLDPSAAAVAIVSEGALPGALARRVKEAAETVTVGKIWETTATRWLRDEVERRGLPLDAAAATALIQRFGSDLGSLGLALDQLAEVRGKITAELVLDRFKNRPNEPLFHYTDAVARGDVSGALRRLGDLLTHQHPLVILASLESELRRRSVALASPDRDTFAQRAGARKDDKWVDRVWKDRSRLKDSGLRRALAALVRADRTLKSAPEDLHRVTLERLTVAMCRWMVGK
jgi:DNA polymerase III delta subunit